MRLNQRLIRAVAGGRLIRVGAIRYYISSLIDTAVNHQKNIRSHWGIENKLHWTLDVAFLEDASRKRNNNAAQNYSILLKIALNLLKK